MKTKLQQLLEGAEGRIGGYKITFVKKFNRSQNGKNVVIVLVDYNGNLNVDTFSECEIEKVIEIISTKPRTIKDGVKEGDMITKNPDYKQKVLGICGQMIFVSVNNEFDEYYSGYTLNELIKSGYKLIQEESKVEELTMEQVCKELGRTVKIKK